MVYNSCVTYAFFPFEQSVVKHCCKIPNPKFSSHVKCNREFSFKWFVLRDIPFEETGDY